MLNRRNFLQLLGGGTVGVLLTPAVYKTVYDAAYWTQNWSWIPRLKYGENAYVPSVSKVCPSGTGVVIRTVSGRPVRALGSKNNLLSQGSLSALAATETQLACATSRVKYPLKRSADNAYVRITWKEANAILADKTNAANGNIAALSGDQNGSINDLFSAFLNKNNSKDFYLMPSEKQDAQIAFGNMGGSGKLGYNIANADCIFAIGANYLENWGTTLHNRKDYASKRPVNGTKSLNLIYAGSGQTGTASGADTFLPCNIDSELAIALGVAHLLIDRGYSANFTGYAEFANFVRKYSPQEVAKITGIQEKEFISAVEALIKSNNALVIVGSELGSIGALPIMAGIACNMLLNNAKLLTSIPFAPKALQEADSEEEILQRNFVTYAQNVATGKVSAPELLFVYSANPLYALPKNAGIDSLLDKSGYTVCFSNFLDETTKKADLVLPDTMGFERFDDVNTPYGSGFVNYSAGQPAAKAPYETASTSDILFKLAQNLHMSFDIAVSGELVAAKAMALGANMADLLDGNTFTANANPVGRLSFSPNILSQAKTPTSDMLQVSACVIAGVGTATTGIPPFATKIITNAQLVGSTMVAQVNKATADKFGLKEGKKFKLSNESGSVLVQIAIFEGVQNNVALLLAGLGHTAFDAFSQNKGDNLINLTSLTREAGTNANMFTSMYVSAEKA